MMALVMFIVNSGPRVYNFYNGSFLSTVISIFVSNRLIRPIFFARMALLPDDLKRRTLCYVIRTITFVTFSLSAIADLAFYSMDQTDETIEDKSFKITAGSTCTFVFGAFDLYLCFIVRQFRDDLILERLNAERVPAPFSGHGNIIVIQVGEGSNDNRHKVVSGVPVPDLMLSANESAGYGFKLWADQPLKEDDEVK